MASYQVNVFVPSEDVNNNNIDASAFLNNMQTYSLGNITIQEPSINIWTNGTYEGQGTMYIWAIADINLTNAQNTYNTFVASHSWNVTPHFLVTLLTSVA